MLVRLQLLSLSRLCPKEVILPEQSPFELPPTMVFRSVTTPASLRTPPVEDAVLEATVPLIRARVPDCAKRLLLWGRCCRLWC